MELQTMDRNDKSSFDTDSESESPLECCFPLCFGTSKRHYVLIGRILDGHPAMCEGLKIGQFLHLYCDECLNKLLPAIKRDKFTLIIAISEVLQHDIKAVALEEKDTGDKILRALLFMAEALKDDK